MLDFSDMTLNQIMDLLLRLGSGVVWAVVILVVGWLCAGWGERAIGGALARMRVADPMLRGFFASLTRWAVLAFTGIAVLERLGVQTTSVVAILGAAGLAVGLALQGTLSNLAAGVMLLLFRPFQVGDSIEGGSLAGSVKKVSLFHTELVTGDNIRVIAPNAVLWNATLHNLSALPTRKVSITVPLSYGAGGNEVLERVRTLMAGDARVLSDPAPAVAVTRLAEKTVEITISFWCASGVVGEVKSDLLAMLWRDFMPSPPAP